jgi:hypothetical protein
VKWVEHGIAPDKIIATSGSRTRPLCPYPETARYVGSGSIDEAENFACVTTTVDLAVSPPTLSKEKVRGGDNVTFTTQVSNLGTSSAANVVVRFLVDGVQLGADQTLSTLSAGGNVTVSSATWSAKQESSSHIVQVVVDPARAIPEANRDNNTASTSFNVQGNKIRNGSFEQSASGASPDGWSGSAGTSYDEGGSDGSRSVSAQPGGSWTSDAVATTPDTSYQASVQSSGAGGTLVVEQLAADGRVLAAATQQILPLAIFQQIELALNARADAAQLRVVLLGPVSGRTSFDNVQLTDG